MQKKSEKSEYLVRTYCVTFAVRGSLAPKRPMLFLTPCGGMTHDRNALTAGEKIRFLLIK